MTITAVTPLSDVETKPVRRRYVAVANRTLVCLT